MEFLLLVCEVSWSMIYYIVYLVIVLLFKFDDIIW